MERVDLEHFKHILDAMLADLERPLRTRDGITIEQAPDALDEVQNAAERELAIRQLEQQSDRFREVKAGIQRIKEGLYGECLRCGSAISIKRLNAVPWTLYCVNCQDVAEPAATETEPAVLQLTERGPKIMRARQSSFKLDSTE